jgi:hypothetical protein
MKRWEHCILKTIVVDTCDKDSSQWQGLEQVKQPKRIEHVTNIQGRNQANLGKLSARSFKSQTKSNSY